MIPKRKGSNMEVLIGAGMVVLAVGGFCAYVVGNMVLANWANYKWHIGEEKDEEGEWKAVVN